MELKYLKYNLFVSGVFGLIRFDLPKTSPKLLRFALRLYYNTQFVTVLLFSFLYLYSIPSIVTDIFNNKSVNNILFILKIICDCLQHIWNITFILAYIYLWFYYQKYLNFFEKLRSFTALGLNGDDKEYKLLAFCIGLEVLRSSLFIYMAIRVRYRNDIWFVANYCIYIVSGFNGVKTIDIFFCIIRYILILMNSLENEILFLKEDITKSSIKSENQNKEIFWQNIRTKIFSVKNLTHEFYNHFHLAVEFFFICNFVYIFSFVTRLASESEFSCDEFIEKFPGLLYLFYLLAISDLIQRKVCYYSNFELIRFSIF